MTALTSFAYTEGTSSLPVAPAQCSRKYLLSRVEVGLASYNIFKGKDYHPPKKIKKKIPKRNKENKQKETPTKQEVKHFGCVQTPLPALSSSKRKIRCSPKSLPTMKILKIKS